MMPNPVHRLPALLEAAVQRLKMAAREAAERTIESLGLAALASTSAYARDGLLGAQFELNRKAAVFVLTFNDALDERMLRELGPRATAGPTFSEAAQAAAGASASFVLPGTGARSATGPGAGSGDPTDWAGLSLVDDKEVEAQISAERFGMEIGHACEWELRELQGYVGSLLGEAGGERDRNPLRPDLVGHAMLRGIDAVSDRADVRRVLTTELRRSLGALLGVAYADIVAGFRNAGVQPLGLIVRNRAQRSDSDAVDRGRDGDPAQDSRRDGVGRHGVRDTEVGHHATGAYHQADPRIHGGADTGSGYAGTEAHRRSPGFAASTRTGMSTRMGAPHSRNAAFGQIDPALMTLIRRLAYTGSAGLGAGGGDDGAAAGGSARSSGSAGGNAFGSSHGSASGGPSSRTPASGFGDSRVDGTGAGSLPPNLIHVHREELRQASRGALDHMVIDVIGFLFDQILADPNVAPQMARQIARLQLPVLRAALGDPGFFSSGKHPVRRFINRIASLGSAFEDYGDENARAFLAQVKKLVQEIVEGDFEQIALYEQKLSQLEVYTAEIAGRVATDDGDAAALLSEKEDQQRLRQLYASRLAGELKNVSAPPFLREFVSGVWSQVLLRAAEQGGGDGPQALRLRGAARELILSVQPKATPAHRKAFLAQLPKLMQDLTEGMNLIGWPDASRRSFFGQLMPAHAEALKSAGGRQLDINLMARQVDGALERPLPSRAELKAVPLAPVDDDVLVAQFSAEEAQQVGLVQESAVDWDGKVDIDLSAEPAPEPAAAALPLAPGLPPPQATDVREPTEGRALADHVQIGFAYQMHLEGAWQKVRLAHVSAARTFFIFTHGGRHQKTVSLTQRMLNRLCETGRLRAFESAYLVERATARARRQLAALASSQAALG